MAVLLSLLSAFLHALWNALLKRERDKDLAGVAVVVVAAAVALVIALALALLEGRVPFGDRGALAWSLGAGLFEGGYFITLVMALQRAPLGLAYTVSRGSAILLVWPLSVLWLHEAVTPAAAVGSALLALGLVVAGLERGGGRGALPLAALCGGFIAGYHLCYKQALAGEPSAAAIFALALAVAAPLNLLRLGARRPALLAALRERPGAFLVGGALCAASFLVFLVALRDAGAGLVLTLRNSSILFAVVLGALLGEPTSRRAVAGAIVVALGATVLGGAGRTPERSPSSPGSTTRGAGRPGP